MIEGAQQKAKLELRLIGAHSPRNHVSTAASNYVCSLSKASSLQAQNSQLQGNTPGKSQQQCVTPKRQISGHSINLPQNDMQTPLSAQISSRLQLNSSFVSKNSNYSSTNNYNLKNTSSLSQANFTRKGKAGSTQIGTSTSSSSSLSSGLHGYCLQQEKLNNSKNNFQKHKSNSSVQNNNPNTSNTSMHAQHKHQIVQFYSSQQQQQQQQHQQTYSQQLQDVNSSSSNLHNIMEIPLSQNNLQSTFSPRVSQRISGDTPSSHSSSDVKLLKQSSLIKTTSTSSSYLKGSSIAGSNVKQGFLSSQSSAGFSQALQKTQKNNNINNATPVSSEKSKQLNAQGSFLKKSQIGMPRAGLNTSNSLLNNSALNNSNNTNTNASFVKQSLSRSPLSGNDKENTFSHDTSPLQKDRESPFSFLQGKSKHSKSPKGTNAVSMSAGLGFQSINTHPANFFGQSNYESASHSGSFLPSSYTSTQHQSSSLYSLQQPGNFFTSQLNNRKKNFSHANANQTEQSQHLSLSPYNRASVTEANNLEASPIPLTGRRAGAGSVTGSSNSFLYNSNVKDSIVLKTNEITPYQFTPSTQANPSQTQQNAPRNYLPKSYLSLDAKSKQGLIMKKQQAEGGKIEATKGARESNEAELSFQQEGDDQQLLSMTLFMQGAAGEEDSNFLNSTNFLNITGMNPLPQPQSLRHANSCSANTSCILASPNQQGASSNNNNNNNFHHNSSGSGCQTNWANSTLAFNNSTQVFNNSSVCANSFLNTTINTILQNMNTTCQLQAKSPIRNEPIFISCNSQTPKLPLDTTPRPAEPSPNPAPYHSILEAQKSVLYDIIVPTIRPITRKFKLIMHPQHNALKIDTFSHSNNWNTNSQITPLATAGVQQQASYATASPSFALSQNSSCSLSFQNNMSNALISNKLTNNAVGFNQISNDIQNEGYNSNQNMQQLSPELENDSMSSNDVFSLGILGNDQLSSKQHILQQFAGIQPSIAESEQSTPVKTQFKVEQQADNNLEHHDFIDTYDGAGFALHQTQQYQINGTAYGIAIPSAQQYIPAAETGQLQMQQYNFSFSNCVNQQKKQEQQQQLHEQRTIQRNEEHYQNALEANTYMQVNQDIQQNNQLVLSPEKPAITMLLSEQITAECISQVSSQMLSPEQPSIASQFADLILTGNMWTIDSFQLGKCIGRGRFGNVYLARHKLSNMLVAIKQINKKNLIESCMEKQLQQEIKIQTYLNHPNVLKMLGFFDDHSKVHLILELASHGDIYKEIKKEPSKKFTEEKAANYIRQICEGLIYLHSQGIIHRDIKPENILNSYGVLKLSDFGWSIYTEEKRMTFCGTLDYVSPEVVSGKDYDFKVDIWSIGVLTYELVTGKPPFENRSNHNEAYQKILQVKYDFPNYLSREAKDFMGKLLVGDPNKRISLEMALNHEWILRNTSNCLADWDSKVSEEILQVLK